MKRVMIVGSAEQSGGGVASVIRLMKKMPVWQEYSCYWLGTQIQRSYLWKAWYAVKSAVIAFCIIWRYDIVHFHTVPDKIGLLIQMPELLLAKLWRKKVILHLHVGNQLENHTEDKFFIWYLQRADMIIVLAKKWKELFKERYKNVNVPVEVVYNACEDVDTLAYDKHDKTILFAGALRPNKAVDLIFEAYAKLKDKYPDWIINVLGDGVEERNLRELASRLGISSNVNFTGYVTGHEKEKYFKRGGIYCMCSYVEGFPMVVLEAWRYGVPVVTTPVGGLPDVIEEGDNCLVFPFGDANAMSVQMDKLMGYEEVRKKMSDYSQQFVQCHFSLTKVNQSLVDIYTSL